MCTSWDMAEIESHIVRLLRRDHLVSGSDIVVTSLSGGVSSDIFLIENGGKRFVMKRALRAALALSATPAEAR